MHNNNRSEVARLKAQIELETLAGKRALHGFAQVGKHEVVTHGMEQMWDDIEKLQGIAGEEVTKQFLMGL